MTKPILANKIFLPVKSVNPADLTKHYEKHLFNDKVCRRCDIFHSGKRPSGECFGCQGPIRNGKRFGSQEGFLGYFKEWSQVSIKGKSYYAVPIGDIDAVIENLDVDLSNSIDLRCREKVKYPLTFTKKLFTGEELRNGQPAPNQVAVVKKFLQAKTGIIEAPPRSGKTVMAAYIVCKRKYKTLILAHETPLLNQFYQAFLDFTDLRKQQKLTGKPIVVVAKKLSDFKKDCDVLIVNYQKFILSEGVKRVAKYLQKRFGQVVVDEVHRAPAKRYIELLDKLDCCYRLTLTATPDRKDKQFYRAQMRVGPIVAKGTVGALVPKVIIHRTDFRPKYEWKGRAGYSKCTSWLFGMGDDKDYAPKTNIKRNARNIMLVKQIFKDLRQNPNNSIIIPTLRVGHTTRLVKMINKQAAYNREHRGEKWPEELAIAYNRFSDKEAVLKKAKTRKVRVVVAIRKMVQDGLDVGPWNVMYMIFPMNNIVNFYQMTQRICTPFEGKTVPVLRMYVDDLGLSINCFKNTWEHIQHYKYKVTEPSQEKAAQIIGLTKVNGKWVDSKPNLATMW